MQQIACTGAEYFLDEHRPFQEHGRSQGGPLLQRLRQRRWRKQGIARLRKRQGVGLLGPHGQYRRVFESGPQPGQPALFGEKRLKAARPG